MPTISLPGTDSPATTSWVSPGGTFYIYSWVTLPLGRAMANGSRNIYVQNLKLYVAGRSGSVSIRPYFAGGARGSYVSYAAQGTPSKKTLTVNTHVNGGVSTNYGVYWGGGGVNFRRGGPTSGQTESSGSSSWDTSLSGTMTYAEAPPAPTPTGVDQATPTSLRARFTSAGDGGTSITGWSLQYSKNSNFSGATTVNSTGTTVVTGLEPDTTYYFRAAGKNAVTNNAGTTGPWSTTFSGKTLESTPGAPTLTLTALSSTQVKLDWAAPTVTGGSPITGYDISQDGDVVASVSDSTLTWTSGVLDTGEHKFRVRAKNANGEGTWSEEKSTTVTRTGQPKVYLSGTAVRKPMKVYLGEDWQPKPVKVFTGGQWLTLL